MTIKPSITPRFVIACMSVKRVKVTYKKSNWETTDVSAIRGNKGTTSIMSIMGTVIRVNGKDRFPEKLNKNTIVKDVILTCLSLFFLAGKWQSLIFKTY